LELARERPDVVAITAAMPGPTGLVEFSEEFSDRFFDVGIAEQHAATSAAAMAYGGLHPVVALYATFLNRAFDQVLMDCALHRAGVTFVLDRSGVTGDDGASHNGMWDLSLMSIVPGVQVAAPRDAAQLQVQLREAVSIADAPTVVRYPKGALPESIPALRHVEGVDVLAESAEQRLLIVSVGAMATECLLAADKLAADGIGVTVVDPRWVFPVPAALLTLAQGKDAVITVEDGGRSAGVGAAIAQALTEGGVHTPCVNLGIPQRFLEVGRRPAMLAEFGLDAEGIAASVRKVANQEHRA